MVLSDEGVLTLVDAKERTVSSANTAALQQSLPSATPPAPIPTAAQRQIAWEDTQRHQDLVARVGAEQKAATTTPVSTSTGTTGKAAQDAQSPQSLLATCTWDPNKAAQFCPVPTDFQIV